MKTKSVALMLVSVLLLIAAIVIASYISANNYGVQIESQLKAERDNNKNILAQYEQKILEAAQVPTMQADDFRKVYTEMMQGRYGANGSKAVFQWIQEQNPTLNGEVYVKLQQIIESGRNDFANSQTKMIDVRRQYEAAQGLFWKGTWLRIAGFPKVNMEDFKPIITDRVEVTYQNGKEAGPLKPR